MKLKHSSGKWIIRKTVDESGDYPFPTYDILAIKEYGPEFVACADQNPYNARLMVCAPRMLDAIIAIQSGVQPYENESGVIKISLHCFRDLKSIIEDATGLKIEELVEEENENHK